MITDYDEGDLRNHDIKTFERLEGGPYYMLPELDEVIPPPMFSGDTEFKVGLRETMKLRKKAFRAAANKKHFS